MVTLVTSGVKWHMKKQETHLKDVCFMHNDYDVNLVSLLRCVRNIVLLAIITNSSSHNGSKGLKCTGTVFRTIWWSVITHIIWLHAKHRVTTWAVLTSTVMSMTHCGTVSFSSMDSVSPPESLHSNLKQRTSEAVWWLQSPKHHSQFTFNPHW